MAVGGNSGKLQWEIALVISAYKLLTASLLLQPASDCVQHLIASLPEKWKKLATKAETLQK